MTNETFDRIKEIIEEEMFIFDPQKVKPDSTLEELEMDSLDQTCIVQKVENEFSITIPDKISETFRTVGDIYNYVANYPNRPLIMN